MKSLLLTIVSLLFVADLYAGDKIVSFCDRYHAKPGGATAEELKKCRQMDRDIHSDHYTFFGGEYVGRKPARVRIKDCEDINPNRYPVEYRACLRADIARGEWSLDQCTKKTAEEVVCPEGTYKFVGSKTITEISDRLVRDGQAKRVNTKPVVVPPTKSNYAVSK